MKVKFYEERYCAWELSFQYDDVPVPQVGDYVREFRHGRLQVKEIVWDYPRGEVHVYCND